MVFAVQLRQLYHDWITSYHLPGLSTVTISTGRSNSRPSTGTMQKPSQQHDRRQLTLRPYNSK
jgi:hypothetical protein